MRHPRGAKRDGLDPSDTLRPGLDIGRDILVHALERDTVIAEMRGGREVEVVDIARKAIPEAQTEFRLEIADLRNMDQHVGLQGRRSAHHGVGVDARHRKSEPEGQAPEEAIPVCADEVFDDVAI